MHDQQRLGASWRADSTGRTRLSAGDDHRSNEGGKSARRITAPDARGAAAVAGSGPSRRSRPGRERGDPADLRVSCTLTDREEPPVPNPANQTPATPSEPRCATAACTSSSQPSREKSPSADRSPGSSSSTHTSRARRDPVGSSGRTYPTAVTHDRGSGTHDTAPDPARRATRQRVWTGDPLSVRNPSGTGSPSPVRRASSRRSRGAARRRSGPWRGGAGSRVRPRPTRAAWRRAGSRGCGPRPACRGRSRGRSSR